MKRILTYILFLSLIAFALSCDDSFLEENKKHIDGYDLNIPLLVEPTTEFTEVSVTLSELKNKDFKIIQYPKNIHFESLKGHINDNGDLKFSIKVDRLDYPIRDTPEELGNIILNINDFGLLSIELFYINLGIPKIAVDEVLDFGLFRRKKQFSINNVSSEGYLLFQIVSAPSWLKVDALQIHEPATVHPDGSYVFHMYVEPIGLSQGNYEDNMVIVSNDPDRPEITIKVKITVPDNKNFYPIAGTIVDCEFSKRTNRLYIAQPDGILVYNTINMTVSEKKFPQGINGITLSEDEKTLLVGQNGFIRVFETSEFSLKQEIGLDYNVTDIVDGENGYYYFSHNKQTICSYNQSNGTIIESGGGDRILKIKDKPYLLVTPDNMGQTGILLVDISNGKQEFIRDWFRETYGLWSGRSNDKIISGFGHIYDIPLSTPPVELQPENMLEFPYADLEHSIYHWIDENPNTGSIWGAFNTNRTVYEPTIIEWDNSTYKKRRSFYISDYYTTVDNKAAYYPFLPKYIFLNDEGSTLFVIKRAYSKDFAFFVEEFDNWHLEIIDVSN